jgi:hypothetical protein
MMLRRAPFLFVACVAGVFATGGPVQGKDGPVARPAPKYEVREENNVLVRMTDGVHLATDLYFPVREPKGLATILIQTPYNKSSDPYAQHGSAARMFASQGFVVAVQDKRGRWTVHHSDEFASYVLLPIIPERGAAASDKQ